MPKKSITIELDSEAFHVLEKRAKKNYTSARDLIEDIVRRSILSYKAGISSVPKVDDRIVGIISRERRGRRRK